MDISAQKEDRTSFKAIMRLVWPLMLMMVFHFLIGFVDVYVAGRIGKSVQASLGIITQSLFLFLIIAMAVANGTVAAVSQSLGAGRTARAARYVGMSLILAAIFGAVILFLGLSLKTPLLNLLQIPEEIRPVTSYFLGVYLLILPAYYGLVVTNAIFRAQKWVKLPFFSMMIVTGVNSFCDFGLGLGMWGLPNLGYKGVAWATFASILAGTLFNLLVMGRRGLLAPKAFPPIRWMKQGIRYLFKVAWPSGVMQILWQTGYLVLYAITASLPFENVESLAGMAAGMRVESILFLPGFAFNMTASILVGHELGAGRPDEAKRVGYKVLGAGCSLMIVMGLVLWSFVPEIVRFLAPAALVQKHATDYLFWNIISIPFTVGSMTLGGIMVGAGATVYNMSVFSVSTWVVRLPLAYLLGHVILGRAEGIWAAMLVSQVFQCLSMLYLFQFRNWSRFGMGGCKTRGMMKHGAGI